MSSGHVSRVVANGRDRARKGYRESLREERAERPAEARAQQVGGLRRVLDRLRSWTSDRRAVRGWEKKKLPPDTLF